MNTEKHRGHGDHAAGAKYIREKCGARLIMSAADYDLVDQQNPGWKPKRDMVAHGDAVESDGLGEG